MSDFLLLAVEGLFALLFVASLWTAVRHRNPLAWDVTLVFMPIATLLVVQLAGQAFGPLPQWVRTASSVFLLAQPLFSLKLVSDIRTVPRWLLPVAVIAFGTTAVLVIAAAGQAAVPVTLAAVGVFVVTEAVAAGYFALEAQRRSGTARLRLAIASFATAALALALFVAGAAAAAGAPAELTNLLARLMALVAVLGYWIAFLPPGWLRRTWQATEAFTYHERLLASPPSAEPGALWTELAQATQHLTGAATVVLVADESALRVVAAEGVELDGPARYSTDALTASPDDGTAPIRRDLCARSGFSVAREVPIVRDRERVGLVVLLRRHASLFDMEDASLVASLAARSANLVQRREVLAEQERLNEQLARTVTALEAAGAAKSDFLASMSHELRTPLNAIIGFSELMVAGSGDTETVSVPREWIDHIRNGGSHLVSLINDVLDLSKVEAGRLELVKVPIQLGHAVAESVAGLRPLADRKQQRIDVEIAPIVIEVDAGRFRQILYNLLSNAIKYTGEG
ncbi:MAG TPA: histidine kinase dimerization/phospho-acceptor domain-containing protein, partial [Vitreimonas sp.]|nr:histidine kinase dimerization/phospho-acceptor domain-containing protein [Vitreimonas sp.]